MILRGYGCVFDQWTRLDTGEWECVDQGAFDRISGRVDMRFEHDGEPVASSSAGTLKLWKDTYGLAFEARVNDDLIPLSHVIPLAMGHLGSSINLRGPLHDAGSEGGWVLRSTDIDHIAVLFGPAYVNTSCWISSGEEWEDNAPRPLRADARRWLELRHQRVSLPAVAALHGRPPPRDCLHRAEGGEDGERLNSRTARALCSRIDQLLLDADVLKSRHQLPWFGRH